MTDDKFHLLPCPFCGGEATGFEWSDDDEKEEWEPHDEDAYCSVKVNHKEDCLFKIGEFGMWIASTEKEAADAWNHRVERTCHMVDNGVELCCSECDWRYDYDDELRFCTGCGARVVQE